MTKQDAPARVMIVRLSNEIAVLLNLDGDVEL